MFFRQPSSDLVPYHLDRSDHAVGENSKNGATTDTKALVPSILAKGCMLDNCAWIT